jgi:hypothetical protein
LRTADVESTVLAPHIDDQKVRLSKIVELSNECSSVDVTSGMDALGSTKASFDQAPNITLVVAGKISHVLHGNQESVKEGFLELVEIGVLSLRELGREHEMVVESVVERQRLFSVALAIPRGKGSHGGRHRFYLGT